MRLNMLKRRQDFLAARGRPDSSLTATHGTKSYLLQARWRQEGMGDQGASGDIGPRYGITVSKHTIRRALSTDKNKPVSKDALQNRAQNVETKRTASKNALKRGPIAVKRNKLRRRLKEALVLVAPKMARDGVDYVVIGRDEGLTIPFEILLKDLEKSFQKVHRRIIPSSNRQATGRRR